MTSAGILALIGLGFSLLGTKKKNPFDLDLNNPKYDPPKKRAIVKTKKPKPAPAPVPKAKPVVTSDTVKHVPVSSPPWPQVVPDDLPPFPSGWTADTPVRPEVMARAAQLLRELWARGEGSHVTEKTAGRWITYVARWHGAKKAIEAFRPKTIVPPATTIVTPVEVQDTVVPKQDVLVTLGPATMDNEPATALPVLKRYDRGPDVTMLQKSFGWTKTTDFFGQQTEDEVKRRQRAAGLPATGVVDAKTWGVLLGTS